MDARILEEVQLGIPVVAEPFSEIAARVGSDSTDVLQRLLSGKRTGLVRRVGAIIDAAALGYRGALIAFRVGSELLDSVGEAVALNAQVSHCYSRDSIYNLWFTLTVPPGGDLESEVDSLASLRGLESRMVLPALRVFKLGVFLKLTDLPSVRAATGTGHACAEPVALSDSERTALQLLQEDMPLVERPFDRMAQGTSLTGAELVELTRSLMAKGVVRRFAAVLNHRAAGYTYNALVCWAVATEQIEPVGARFAEDSDVSHCYQRPAFADWPYSVYTMVHSRSADGLGKSIDRLSALCDNAPRVVLSTLREYKKSRVRYSI